MIIIVARRRGYRRRSAFATRVARSYRMSWIIPLAGVALFLAAFWPLLAFRRSWATVQAVPCYPDAWVRFGAVCSGVYRAPVAHSGVSGLGVGLTALWLLLLLGCGAVAVAVRRL